MSTVKAINLQHPSSANTNIVMDNGGNLTVNGSLKALTSSNTYIALDNNAGSPRLDFYDATNSPSNILGYIQSDGLVINGAGGTERMRINSSGYITTPYQPRFTGFVSDGGSWRTLSSATLIKMNTINVNQGSCYNSSTGLFTCPVAGTYKITVWALMGQGEIGRAHV